MSFKVFVNVNADNIADLILRQTAQNPKTIFMPLGAILQGGAFDGFIITQNDINFAAVQKFVDSKGRSVELISGGYTFPTGQKTKFGDAERQASMLYTKIVIDGKEFKLPTGEKIGEAADNYCVLLRDFIQGRKKAVRVMKTQDTLDMLDERGVTHNGDVAILYSHIVEGMAEIVELADKSKEYREILNDEWGSIGFKVKTFKNTLALTKGKS